MCYSYHLLCALLCLVTNCYSQGTVGSVYRFSNICGSKNGFVYGVDPNAPYSVIRSFDQAVFSGRPLLSGEGYTAELWLAPGSNAEEESLEPIATSATHFLQAGNSGLYKGPAELVIPHTLGGDLFTLQIRIWDNRSGTIASWADVLADDTVPRVTSRLITNYELSGLDAEGRLRGLPLGCRPEALESLGLYVVPEPNVAVFLGFALAVALAIRLPRSRLEGWGRSRSFDSESENRPRNPRFEFEPNRRFKNPNCCPRSTQITRRTPERDGMPLWF